MTKVDIAGLKIDSITKKEFLDEVARRIPQGQKTSVFTPYSEFLYNALKHPELLGVYNSSDFNLPDGIGIFWAAKYLSIPLTAKSYFGKILQAVWQAKWTLTAILLRPKYIQNSLRDFPIIDYRQQWKNGHESDKISGSDLIWDLAELAAKNNFSVFLFGGAGDTTKIVAEKLFTVAHGRAGEQKLKIAGWSNKKLDDPGIIDDINRAEPDMLFVALKTVEQEKWIAKNFPKIGAKFVIGLGGAFDYLAGKRQPPPKFIRKIGLEWLWRLLTQPHRIRRIINATFGLVNQLVHYKIRQSSLKKSA